MFEDTTLVRDLPLSLLAEAVRAEERGDDEEMERLFEAALLATTDEPTCPSCEAEGVTKRWDEKDDVRVIVFSCHNPECELQFTAS